MKAVIFFLVFAGVYGCEQWPNGTDWASCGTKAVYYKLWPTDQNNNPEYPIHLGKPLIAHANLTNLGSVYSNLKLSIKIYEWGGWTGCSWHELPTFGLLTNLDACANGVKCPIPTGNQILDVTLDFSKFQSIIDLLKDNAPYQIWMQLQDVPTGDTTCVTVQARALLH
uniref:MD-2-related lipid-recognition domain-containing protein n=1 Tax=Panagrolaimus sp. JU765 TaxID=591449 RepID=A0AC34QGZ7_9BILA